MEHLASVHAAMRVLNTILSGLKSYWITLMLGQHPRWRSSGTKPADTCVFEAASAHTNAPGSAASSLTQRHELIREADENADLFATTAVTATTSPRTAVQAEVGKHRPVKTRLRCDIDSEICD